MQVKIKQAALAVAACSVASLSILTAPVQADTTVSFQNGDANGYAGGFDRQVYSFTGNDASGAGGGRDANTNGEYGIDGFQPYIAAPDPKAQSASPDSPLLLRFDNIFGNAPGQIPLGAYILNAQLNLTSQANTYDSSTGKTTGSAQSGGPFGIAQLISPFTSSTVYSDYSTSADAPGTGGNRGPWFENGQTARPVAGFGKVLASTFDKVLGQETTTVVNTAQITPLVQAWSGGAPQNGMTVQSGFTGTADAWGVRSNNYATVADRPKLTVSYTTDPVTVATFRQGVNGYSGTTMAKVQHDATVGAGTTGDTTFDGNGLTPQFLDHGAYNDTDTDFSGPTVKAHTGSDSAGVLKFSNVFAKDGGSVPDNANIVKAYVIVTTSDDASSGSLNNRSPGPWEIDQLAQSWDTTTLYNNYPSVPDANGQKLGPGTGPADIQRDTQIGMIADSQVWFDVTASLLAFQNGTANNGWAIRGDTGDGWAINFLEANPDVNPELYVAYSSVPEPGSLALLGLLAPVVMRRRRRA
jgi:hypothetical protein